MKIARYLLFMPLFLAGCGASNSQDLRARTEESVRLSLTERMKEKKVNSICTSVSLVETSPEGQYPQSYTGVATFSSGNKVDVKVHLGSDGKIIWQGP